MMFSTNDDIYSFLNSHASSCGNYHMEALQQVLDAVESVVVNNVSGDFIEIGVYKGVMVMAVCAKLVQLGVTDRYVHLYDTFEGMVSPSDKDLYCHSKNAPNMNEIKNYCSLQSVKNNMSLTGYPDDKIIYHMGDICKTDVSSIPVSIAFLRLDTDWYESTVYELKHFSPNVSNNGITQDDYNWWTGATEAVDLYLSEHPDIKPNKLKPHGIWWVHKQI